MRYLKDLNEDKLEQWEITDIHNDVNDILDNYSTYLVDKGFKFNLEFPYYEDRDVLRITLTRVDRGSYSWNDIKDDFIPLCEILSKSYNIFGIDILSEDYYSYELKDILDDSIRLRSIGSIKFIDINIFLVSKVKKPSLVSRFKNFFKKK